MSLDVLISIQDRRVETTTAKGQKLVLVYQPDPTELFHTEFGKGRSRGLLFRALPPPEEWLDLAAYASPCLEQKTGSCTGHAEVSATETCMNAAGSPLPFHASPAEVYRNGRAIDRPYAPSGAPVFPLEDTGAMPSQVARAVEEFGLRKTKAADGVSSDDDPAHVNDEPNFEDLAEEALFVPKARYSIGSCSSGAPLVQVVTALKSALSCTAIGGVRTKGLPVTTAAFVDTAFMNWTGGMAAQGACNTMDLNGGGHAFVVLGYRKGTDGRTEFLVKNSWGPYWGTSVNAKGTLLMGCIWVTEDFIASCVDFRVHAPKL